jgi:hypothetical protein
MVLVFAGDLRESRRILMQGFQQSATICSEDFSIRFQQG